MRQLPQNFLIPVLVCSTLIIQACALPFERFAPTLDPVSLANAELVDESVEQLDTLNEGDSVTFESGFLARMGQVSIGREYYSASGRMCKQILDKSNAMLVGVACKQQDQKWYTRQGS